MKARSARMGLFLIDGMSGTVPPQLHGSPPPFRGDKHFQF